MILAGFFAGVVMQPGRYSVLGDTTAALFGAVFGDYLEAGLGDISGISAEVWVEATDLERAEAILRHHQSESTEVARPDNSHEVLKAAPPSQSST